MSFTRHSKSVVANTCSHSEYHLAQRSKGCECNGRPHSSPQWPQALPFPVKLASCCTKGHLRTKLSPPQCPLHSPGPHPHSSVEARTLPASEGTGWWDRVGEKETGVQGEVSEGHAAGNLSSGLNSKARVLHVHHLSFSGQSCSPTAVGLAHCPE